MIVINRNMVKRNVPVVGSMKNFCTKSLLNLYQKIDLDERNCAGSGMECGVQSGDMEYLRPPEDQEPGSAVFNNFMCFLFQLYLVFYTSVCTGAFLIFADTVESSRLILRRRLLCQSSSFMTRDWFALNTSYTCVTTVRRALAVVRI